MNWKDVRLAFAFSLIAVAVGAPTLPAQTVLSTTKYDQVISADDRPVSVLRDGSGNYFVVVSSGWGTIVTKFNSLQTPQWRRYYQGGGNEAITPTTAVLDPGGDIVVLGTSSTKINGSNVPHLTALRLASSNGAELYKTYPMDVTGWQVSLTPASIDAAGNIGFTGWSTNTPGDPTSSVLTAITVKYADGSLKWSKPIPSPNGVAAANRMRPDANGDWYVAGSVYEPDRSHYAFAVWKLRAWDGAGIWRVERTGAPTVMRGIAQDLTFTAAGNPVAVGSEWLSSTSGYDQITTKLDPTTGNPQWLNNDHLSGNDDFASSVLIEPTTGDVLVGGVDTAQSPSEPFAMRLSASTGTRQWLARYPSIAVTAIATSIQFDGAGGLLLGVQGFSDNQSRRDVYSVDVDVTSGAVNWGNRFPNAYGKDDRYAASFVDGSNIVVVGATDSGPVQLHDIFFQRLNRTNGAPQSVGLVDQSTSGDITTLCSAVSPDGAFAISGQYTGDGQEGGAFTILYNADGTIRWSRSTANTSQMKWPFLAMAFGPDGSLYGGKYVGNPADFSVVKLSGTDGSLLWEGAYSTAGSQSDDRLTHLVVASNGDAIALGTASVGFTTARFSSVSGSQIWAQKYSTGTGHFDDPGALSLAANGDVLVSAWTEYSPREAFTLRLRGSDGVQIWRSAYNLSGNDDRETPAWSGSAANGDHFVAGLIRTNSGEARLYAQRLASSDGHALWSTTKTIQNVVFADCAITPAGDLLLTGDDFSDAFALKIRGADGAIAWTKTISIEGDIQTQAIRVTPDSSGNALVCVNGADSMGLQVQSYLYTLSGTDGATLWRMPLAIAGADPASTYFLHPTSAGNLGVISLAKTKGPYRGARDMYLTRVQPRSSATRSISGKVLLADFQPSLLNRNVTLEIRTHDGGFALATLNLTLAADGSFSAQLPMIDGSYDLTLRCPHFLSKGLTNFSVSGTAVSLGTNTLLNGDVNGDNRIDAADQTLLTAAFRSTPAKPNWNPNADLNGDGQVSASDQAILGKNFGKGGDD